MDVRKAEVRDAQAINALISGYSANDVLLPRTVLDIYRNIREFFVYTDSDGIAGCAALQVAREDLAEIKSLAVDQDKHGRGIGTDLVNTCLKEARAMNIPAVFVLTRETDFFARLGFKPVDKSELPQKIWSDCVVCQKFPDCDEEAMILKL